jgi:hypothetical protein
MSWVSIQCFGQHNPLQPDVRNVGGIQRMADLLLGFVQNHELSDCKPIRPLQLLVKVIRELGVTLLNDPEKQRSHAVCFGLGDKLWPILRLDFLG